MASTKGGLIPHSNMLGGATDSSGTQQFFIKASETADYFQGDLCLIDANGEIQPSTAVTDTITVGQSGMCLDSGTAGATTVAQLKLIGLTDVDGSDSPISAVRATTYSYGLVILESSINRYLSVTGI